MSSINDEKYFERKIVQYNRENYEYETVIFEDENIMFVKYDDDYSIDTLTYHKAENEIFTFSYDIKFINNINEELMYRHLFDMFQHRNPFDNNKRDWIYSKYKSIKRKKLIDSL